MGGVTGLMITCGFMLSALLVVVFRIPGVLSVGIRAADASSGARFAIAEHGSHCTEGLA